MKEYSNNLNTIGNQRDWVWRGWQIRYTFKRVLPEYQATDIPLILLHGFGASIHHWRKNIPILSEKHTVYAIDLLGFGASKKAYTSYQIKLWGELIYDFWQTFINQPIILIGNSIGSLIALYVAANYPKMVKGLVMLSLPDVTQKQAMIPKVLQPIINTIEKLVASPLLIKTIFYIVRRPNFIRRGLQLAYVNQNAVTDELVEIICKPTQDKDAARTLVALTKNANKPDYSPSPSQLLNQLEIPILLIWGQGDRLIPVKLASQFTQQNHHIELQLLDGVGHCPQDECPDKFHQILSQWLNKNFSNDFFNTSSYKL
jgi:haloalkane dehalogenase